MAKRPRAIFVIIAAYLLLVAAAGLYVLYRETFAPAGGAFAGGEFAAMGIVALTLPWSFVLDSALGRAPGGGGTTLGMVTRYRLCSLINAAVFYALFRIADRAG